MTEFVQIHLHRLFDDTHIREERLSSYKAKVALASITAGLNIVLLTDLTHYRFIDVGRCYADRLQTLLFLETMGQIDLS